eukprot:CAMPEP_0174272932 /NCGR_PEP_ID=MMETSP0439-20130205/52808_1 /TAXON_ID=0 /ORGANISM="Stereomyxa ramosa, Strain Chinc5" /LENGTH=922 /DNA_ID=CAMNT_0015363763 /DNA_START=16 /DNA_END=2782 /DNA_ORIENTATION=+
MQFFLSSQVDVPLLIKILRFEVPVPKPKNPLFGEVFDFLDESQEEVGGEGSNEEVSAPSDPTSFFSNSYRGLTNGSSDPSKVPWEDKTDDQNSVFLTLNIFAESKPLINEIQIPHDHFKEWLVLPLQYKDLPLTSQVVITLWTCLAPRKRSVVAGTCFPLFNSKQRVKKGKHKLRLWPRREGDGNVDTKTPGKVSTKIDEGWRLEKLVQTYKRNQMPRVGWLDQITFKQIAERIHHQGQQGFRVPHIYIEFPAFEHNVVFHQKKNPEADPRKACSSDTPLMKKEIGKLQLTVINDAEIDRPNPNETKYLKLMRYNRVLLDRDLKPDKKEEETIKKILNYPLTHILSTDDKEFIWKFRFYLRNNARALTKFCKCVDWTYHKDRKQAIKLLEEWAEIDVDDALELLSASFSGIKPVRRYAICKLQQAEDEELLSYLLQLVQALRYDKDFLSDVELEKLRTLDSSRDRKSRVQHTGRKKSIVKADSVELIDEYVQSSDRKISELSTFLINRALENRKMANFLYWYLTVESPEAGKPDKKYGQSYAYTLQYFISQLSDLEGGDEIKRDFMHQTKLIKKLAAFYKKIKMDSRDRKVKIEDLKKWLEPMKKFKEPFSHPLNPDRKITGIIPELAYIFSSAMAPFKITFSCEPYGENEEETFTVIYKCGDDLRQDQLIIQLISLMDNLTKKYQLDLKLTSYAVLATSCDDGFVEFIESQSLGYVLFQTQGKNKIQNFLREKHPDQNGRYGIAPEVMNNFVKSVAGYCVMTYILGVGDRHLDNLLIRDTGQIFHIDFGYFLGREPPLKGVFPPPFKLTPQMVDAMGGQDSDEFKKLQEICWSEFKVLRENANIILNLFSLMIDAEIDGIEFVGGGLKAILKVQEKFLLELSDEKAIIALQNNIGTVLALSLVLSLISSMILPRGDVAETN